MPIIVLAAIIVAAFLVIRRIKGRKAGRRGRRRGDWLEYVLFSWPTGDPFTRRDLMRSVAAYGVTGSGKTSGSLMHILDAVVDDPRSTLFIVAQKPEDRRDFERLFKRHGRRKKLLVVDSSAQQRCNLIDTELKAGASTLDLTDLMTTLGEALVAGGGKGGENELYWAMMQQRIIYNAIGAVRMAGLPLLATTLREFLATAAYSTKSLPDPHWQAQAHNRIMQAAFKAEKGKLDSHDFENLFTYWMNEFPAMDDKPRTSALAGVMNTLHVFNTGLVREICSTDSTITPSVMEDGYSALIDLPFTIHGQNGRFIAGGLRRLWQNHILRRHARPGDFYNVMVLDEYQESVTAFDARFIAQCRSHLGCMFTLTQTIDSMYGVSGGGSHHKVQALQSNFGHRIYHTVDPQTAEDASKLAGQYLEEAVSIGPSGQSPDLYDQIHGNLHYQPSISYQWQPKIKVADLMRQPTGGPACGNKVGGMVVRLGQPFLNGENFQFVLFDQR
jgi:hypothetical protein